MTPRISRIHPYFHFPGHWRGLNKWRCVDIVFINFTVLCTSHSQWHMTQGSRKEHASRQETLGFWKILRLYGKGSFLPFDFSGQSEAGSLCAHRGIRNGMWEAGQTDKVRESAIWGHDGKAMRRSHAEVVRLLATGLWSLIYSCQHLSLGFQQRGRLGRTPWLVWLVLVEVKTDIGFQWPLLSDLYFCPTRFEEISFWNPHRMNKKPTWIVWGFWLFHCMRAVQLVFEPQVLICELCGRCCIPSAENMLVYSVHTSQSARYWSAALSLWSKSTSVTIAVWVIDSTVPVGAIPPWVHSVELYSCMNWNFMAAQSKKRAQEGGKMIY